MNKKILVLLVGGLALALIVGSIAVTQWSHPHNVDVLPPIIEYLAGEAIANDTAIDWGSQPPGVYYYNYTILNNSTYRLNVTIYFSDFPYSDGFMISWLDADTHDDLNMTIIEASTSAIGDLTLVIPLGASGSYTWTHWLLITEATPP